MRPTLFACVAVLAFVTGPAFATETATPRFDGWQGPKPSVSCQCRHKDGRANVGQTLCIRQGSKQVLATCTQVLNNTIWRVIEQSCTPTS